MSLHIIIQSNIIEQYDVKEAKILAEGKRVERSSAYSIKRRRIILVAAILAAIALAITACAVVEPIKNYIIEITDVGTSFRPVPETEKTQNSNDEDFSNIENGLNFVPSNFVIDESYTRVTDYLYTEMYYNGQKYIEYVKARIDSSSNSFDSEGTPTQILNIDGKEVFLFTKWKTDQAVWHDDTYRYTLSYPEELDFSEVEKMIKSAR